MRRRVEVARHGANMGPGRLKDELRKKEPFSLPEQEATLNILRTSDQLQNRFGKLFRDFGLTPSQYNVLRILRGEGQPLSCLDISERMIQVVPAMTGLLDRLESAQLVTRQRCTHDRRVVYVSLTDQARQLLDRLDEPVQSLHRQLLGHMSAAELAEVSRLMEKARVNVSG